MQLSPRRIIQVYRERFNDHSPGLVNATLGWGAIPSLTQVSMTIHLDR